MCGIFLYFSESYDEEKINTYFLKGKKRGPDNSIYDKKNNVIFGFHRLSINGMDTKSNQPLYHNNYRVICNGEIFNYKFLIKKYNIITNTNSDCEVLLHLFKQKGISFIEELDGEFSFIIHDLQKDELFVVRDYFGIRPLFIYDYDNELCVSSDVQPCMIVKDPSKIKPFLPGTYNHYKKIDNKFELVSQNPYLNVIENTKEVLYNNEQLMTSLYDSLYKSIFKRVTNSHQPVACLLSGGLDSSIVCAISNQIYKKLFNRPIETFSIGMEGSTDLEYSLLVANHIQSKHTQITLTENEMFYSIPEVIKDIESYDTTTVRASVGNWNIGKYIRKNSKAKVILNGDGADELMGGYLYFHKCPDEEEFHKECVRLLKNIHRFDVLRSDKSISSHGLEPRTPFLDIDFVKTYLSIPKKDRIIGNKQEKHIIRNAIFYNQPDLLPKEVLFRKKEAFSDGVSSEKKSWYEIINNKIKENYEKKNYIHNSPKTKEQNYYRFIFEYNYPNMSSLIPYFWMPKYINATDSSARTLSIY